MKEKNIFKTILGIFIMPLIVKGWVITNLEDDNIVSLKKGDDIIDITLNKNNDHFSYKSVIKNKTLEYTEQTVYDMVYFILSL